MINLSASMIKDYLACSQRAYYRFNYPEESIEIEEITIGNVVHKVLEKEWRDYDRAIKLSKELLTQYNLPSGYRLERIDTALRNFFSTFTSFFNERDNVEYKFNIPYAKDNTLRLVGKIDRICDGIIFDWKVSYRVPESIDNDVQFIMYYIAYSEIFNHPPDKVYYVSLLKNSMVEFRPKEYFINTFYNEIISNVADEIKKKHFYREGMYNNKCEDCLFQSICWRQLWEQST